MLNYSISLINVWFAGNGIDTRYFDSVTAQRAYFAPLCQPVEQKNINFNMGDNVSTVINYTDTSDRPIEEIIGSNYCVVRRYSDDGETIESERYYFAVVQQLSGRNLQVNLKLDSIQTHYFNYKNTIAECHINRACLNRFEEVKGSTTEVKFIGGVNSPLLNSEETILPKTCIDRITLYPNPDFFGTSALHDASGLGAWVYILIADNEKFPEGAFAEFSYEGITLPYKVLCAPVSREFYVGHGETNQLANWTLEGLLGYIKSRELTPYIYSYKVSGVPPFISDVYTTDDFYNYSVGRHNIIGINLGSELIVSKGNVQFYSEPHTITSYVASLMGGNCTGLHTSNVNLKSTTGIDFTFNKSDIVGADKSYKFNPKYLSTICLEARLCDCMGNSFTYDLQKINRESISFDVDEPVLADNTRGYVRYGYSFNSINEGQPYYGCKDNYVGLVVNNDTSLLYEQTAIETFNANNKNFGQIQQAQRDYNTEQFNIYSRQRTANMLIDTAGSALTGALGILTGNSLATAIGLSSTATAPLSSLSDVAFAKESLNAKNNFSKLNETLTLDNIRCSPSSLRNGQGSIIFNSIATSATASLSCAYFLEIWRGYETDIERFNDIIVEYGFSYERIGNVADFDNIRKYFNYIAAEIETISAPISIQEKNDIRDRFKGIRFWNVDTVDFTLENYEQWLEGDNL